jgi:RES domain-containing protein
MARSMARMMAARRQMHQRRRRRRRMLLLVGGMAVLGYAGYKLSQRNVKRVEEHTGKEADELTDEQLEQAMDQLGIEKETMTDEEWAQAQEADAEPDYIVELRRLGELHTQGILTDEEFTAKKQEVLGL